MVTKKKINEEGKGYLHTQLPQRMRSEKGTNSSGYRPIESAYDDLVALMKNAVAEDYIYGSSQTFHNLYFQHGGLESVKGGDFGSHLRLRELHKEAPNRSGMPSPVCADVGTSDTYLLKSSFL